MQRFFLSAVRVLLPPGTQVFKRDGEGACKASDDFSLAKKENYEKVYNFAGAHTGLKDVIAPMMAEVYNQLLEDMKGGVKSSPIFTHHINYINKAHYKRETPYEQTEPNQIVVDYIASMTDDYFSDLYAHLFPDSPMPEYKSYFE